MTDHTKQTSHKAFTLWNKAKGSVLFWFIVITLLLISAIIVFNNVPHYNANNHYHMLD